MPNPRFCRNPACPYCLRPPARWYVHGRTYHTAASSLRDIGRELGHSRTAIANAVLRLGRQAMSSHINLMRGLEFSGSLTESISLLVNELTHFAGPGALPRTTSNPLFLMNHIDRMIRHRVKEHTRETIAGGHNSTF